MIARMRTITMGSTITCRALHTALRQITTQIPIEFCTLVIGLVLGVTQREYTIKYRYDTHWFPGLVNGHGHGIQSLAVPCLASP